MAVLGGWGCGRGAEVDNGKITINIKSGHIKKWAEIKVRQPWDENMLLRLPGLFHHLALTSEHGSQAPLPQTAGFLFFQPPGIAKEWKPLRVNVH